MILILFFWDLETHTVSIFLPHQPLPLGEDRVQHSPVLVGSSATWRRKFFVSVFQKPSGLRESCCVVPLTDIGVVEAPSKDQGL